MKEKKPRRAMVESLENCMMEVCFLGKLGKISREVMMLMLLLML